MPTKITLILIACSLFSVLQRPLQAQNSFGELLYPHSGSILTSGSVTRLTPGFLIAGHKPVCTQGANFYIDRTAQGGDIFNNPQGFQREYSIFTANSNCAAPFTQAINCSGVSVLETQVPGFTAANGVQVPQKDYVVAGAVDNGCFFSFLSSNGAPVNSYFINFALIQGVPFISSVSKPIIAEASNPISGTNEYYICGTYNVMLPILNYPISIFYAHRVNALGSIIWSRQYLCSTGGFVTIKDMLESPYNQNLVIVGGTLFSGLLIELDRATGGTNVATANLYNVKNYPSGFSSIAVSMTGLIQNDPVKNPLPSNPAGYVIGGENTSPTNKNRAWMTKITPVGNVIWSTVMTPSSDRLAGNINDILERINTSGSLEYYGVTSSSAGAMVLKLDQQGYPFSTGFNEFVYNAGTPGNPSTGRYISFSDASGTDEGLHIFGNNLSNSSNAHYLVQAYFSGHAGCNTPVNVSAYERPEIVRGPSGLYDMNLPLTHCAGFAISSNVVSAYTPVCGPVYNIPLPANNDRSIATAISPEDVAVEPTFNIFPNPVSDRAILTYEAVQDKEIKVELYNSIGQLITTLYGNKQQNTVELDFAALKLESGVYFVSSNDGHKSSKQKVVYNKM